MTDHPKFALPLRAIARNQVKADGIDLADMEAHERALQAERAKLLQRTILIPGQKKALLETLDLDVAEVGSAIRVAQEHVRPDPVAFEIYQARKAEHLKAEFDRAESERVEREKRATSRRKEKSPTRGPGAELDPTD